MQGQRERTLIYRSAIQFGWFPPDEAASQGRLSTLAYRLGLQRGTLTYKTTCQNQKQNIPVLYPFGAKIIRSTGDSDLTSQKGSDLTYQQTYLRELLD